MTEASGHGLHKGQIVVDPHVHIIRRNPTYADWSVVIPMEKQG
ncbi:MULTISPECIES: hypothetical protein [unclassified Bifidobacterium]|nr:MULTISPECIES: hypothetical protein [unclassified Bifidobacterium]